MNQERMIAIVTTLSIAMVGATVMVSYGVILQAEAATTHTWCYDIPGDGRECFERHNDCNKDRKLALETNPDITHCYKLEPA
jgi:hypothetical protein